MEQEKYSPEAKTKLGSLSKEIQNKGLSQLPTSLILSAILVLWLVALTLYASKEYGDYTNYLGTMGDFIGGLLNPVLAFVTIFLLIKTINQNQEIIKINSEELEKSNIELQKTRTTLSKDVENNQFKINLQVVELVTNNFEEILYSKITNEKYESAKLIEAISAIENPITADDHQKADLLKYFLTGQDDHAILLKLGSILRLSHMFDKTIREIVPVNKNLSIYFQEHVIVRTLRIFKISIENFEEDNTQFEDGIIKVSKSILEYLEST